MNLYIESIEGGTYIAGIGETKPEKMLTDTYRNTQNFISLVDIKDQVAGQHFEKIWLTQNTPYDEMCGSPEKNQKLSIELEWD